MKLLTALIAAQFLLVVISSYASAQLTIVESVKLLEAQMLAARQEIDQLKKDNDQLNSEVDGLEGDVSFLTNQIEAANKEINRLEALVIVLELQAISLRNSLSETNAELQELKDVVGQFIDLSKPEYEINGAHTQQITDVSFSVDNQFLITSSTESRINVWREGKFYKVLEGIDGPVNSFALNLDNHLVTGSEFGNSVLVFNETYDLIENFTDIVNGVYKVAIDLKNKEQAYIGSNRKVYIVHLLGESPVITTEGHLTAPVHALAVDLNRELLFTGCLYDSKIYVWNALDASYKTVLTGDTTPVETIIYDPRSESLISGHQDGVIGLWDVKNLGNVRLLRGHTDRTLSLALRVNGDFLFSASQDRTIKIWDLKTDSDTPFRSIPFNGKGIPTTLDINQVKDQLVIGSSAGDVQVITIEKLLF